MTYTMKKVSTLTASARLFACALLAFLMTGSSLLAQIPGYDNPPREDDHFQRWLVVNRIDLDEKMNRPIVATADPSLYAMGKYGENNGLVNALINGIKSGKYLAYDADSLNKSLTYEDVVELAQRINGEEEEEEIWEIEEEEFPYDEELDETIYEGGSEDDADIYDTLTDADADGEGDFQIAPFETAVEFIENRIFDKNRSDMVYNIQYIRLVWVDPGETLPDKNFICLKYSDVVETLEDTAWKNRFNDAEDRNLREVFDQRMFNSFATNISGKGVRTLPETEHRRNQLLEFEHHLWSF